ncbi:hypothetical protein AM10699_06710 [Acaryochloris marina MBIC10699]|nr:hypothetical protein AM10699_06710 [Acaryochloris marina MBIC10699]
MLVQAVSDQRSQRVCASKVFANHLKYEQVIEAGDRSLHNLQTDYMDLYQIHGPVIRRYLPQIWPPSIRWAGS